MNRTFEILGFTEIIEMLAERAVSQQAKENLRLLRPSLSETELRRNLRETTQARRMLDLVGQPPSPVMERVEECRDRAVRGELLLPEEIEAVGAFLTAVSRMNAYLKRGQRDEIGLAFYAENLIPLEDLREEIARTVRSGEVDDRASAQLFDIRRELGLLEEKIKERAEALLRSGKNWMAEQFVVRRNGRICLPVKKEFKGKVEGSVVDKSATGATLFVEPAALAKLREQIDLLRIEEDCEVRRILYTLLDGIAQQEQVFKENLGMLVKLDVIFARGKLSADMQAVEPEINTEGRIALTAARHPMLARETCVPLNFALGGDKRGIVITGPNTGGKTVAIKTVGLMALMAASGLHVPCEQADICMANQVLCDIGDGQNINDNLSTFSAHIKNVLDILRRVTRDSIVILDELGAGTDPAEGMGIAIAILEQLRKSGCLFLATTHYPEVKTYAGQHGEILNARMAFDRENLKPLYRLEIGKAGESCALYIAKRLGMPDDMLTMAAERAYGAVTEELCRELHLGENGKNEFRREPAPALQRMQKRRIGTRSAAVAGAGGMACEGGAGGGAIREGEAGDGMNAVTSPREFSRGDSVTVLPGHVIGIVVKPADEMGNVLVQIKGEKVVVNRKRLKLKVAASQLYPEDYDFSIIFDSVETRKARHQMGKHHVEGLEIQVDGDRL